MRHGAKLNQSEPWPSPLHIATSQSNLDAVTTLLDLGSNILAIDLNGATVLHTAVQACCCRSLNEECEHYNILKEILDFAKKNGITIKDLEESSKLPHPILSSCLDIDNFKLMEILIENNADLSATNNLGETVLHRAAWLGNDNVIEGLAQNGADIEARDLYGYSPLHNSVANNNIRACRSLIQGGANIDARTTNLKDLKLKRKSSLPIKTKQGFTPIQLAIINNNSEMVKFLVSQKADCNLVTQTEQYGVLQLAHRIWSTHKLLSSDLDRYLALYAGDINTLVPNEIFKRPAHLMTIAMNVRDQFLAKAICSNKNMDPTEALQLMFDAVKFHQGGDTLKMCDNINTLLSRGASPNIKVIPGKPSPLVWLVKNGDFATIKLALQSGAHVDEKVVEHRGNQSREYSALEVAINLQKRNLHDKKVQLLLAANCNLQAYWKRAMQCDKINNNSLDTGAINKEENGSDNFLANKIKDMSVSLKEAAQMVPTLQQSARKCIRSTLRHSKQIEQLPLPKCMKKYLYIPELQAIVLSDLERLHEMHSF